MAQPKLNPGLARRFLEALYGPYYYQATRLSYLEVRGRQEVDPPGTMPFNRFYLGFENLLKNMSRWKPELHYWIGVAPRKSDKRGRKVDCIALPALYSDVDYGHEGHRKKNKWQTKEEAQAAIQSFPLLPSIWIHSGGGFQLYWLLKEPLGVENGNYAQVEAMMKGITMALGGDVGTQDISRILRLPGTFNVKIAGNPRPVEIVCCEPERIYPISDFVEYEALAHRPKNKTEEAGPNDSQTKDLGVLNIPKWVKGLIISGDSSGYDNDRSERDHAVIGALVQAGYSLNAIEAIYQAHPIGDKYREKKEHGRKYLQASFDKALSEHEAKSKWENPEPKATTGETLYSLPPPFPIDIFPERCQKAIIEIQRAYSVPVDIPAVALISEAGACIGRTRGIQIKDGWIEHANTWIVIVGKSGLGKSPVVRAIQRPVFGAEEKWYAEYQEALKKYELEMETRKFAPRRERGQLGSPPDPPKWTQLIVDDTTTEALTDAFDANRRGILWNRDELSGLILDLDKYSGKEGGTKSRLMSSYDSGAWKVNRRDKSKKAFIPQATLSIFGTIQPKALSSIFSNLDAATGFLPRFIFISTCLEEPPLWTDRTVSGDTHRYLTSLTDGLLALNFNDSGEASIVGVSPEAKAVYQEWYNEQVMEPWVDTSAEVYEAVLAKLRGQCLRLALILHCIEAVTRGSSELKPVSHQTMQNAIRLADCVKAHQKRVWGFVINPGQVSDLTPLQKRVARSIVALESEIHGGMLPTARIAQEINKGVDHKFHISVESAGKAASNLGFKSGHLPDKSARTIIITETDLHKFKSIFKTTVRTVRSVPNPDMASGRGQNQTVPEPSEVSSHE